MRAAKAMLRADSVHIDDVPGYAAYTLTIRYQITAQMITAAESPVALLTALIEPLEELEELNNIIKALNETIQKLTPMVGNQ